MLECWQPGNLGIWEPRDAVLVCMLCILCVQCAVCIVHCALLASSQAQHQVQGGLLLDVIIAKK
jgi:hypothetical protein